MTTAAMSDYLENKVVNHVLRNTAFSPPANIYLALYTGNPTDTGSGSTTEIDISASAASYQRVRLSNAFVNPTGGSTSNSAVILFNTATGSWGNVAYIGLVTGSQSGTPASTGSILFYGALSGSKTVTTGDTFSIATGDLDVSLTGAYSAYLGNALLNSILNGVSYTSPGDEVWAALYIGDVSIQEAGFREVIAGDYGRVQVGGTAAWTAPINGSTVNTGELSFVTSASADWGTVASMALLDAQTSGNILFSGAFGTPKTVLAGDGFKFIAGAIRIDVDRLPTDVA